jgi:Tol biopolymer transport system component
LRRLLALILFVTLVFAIVMAAALTLGRASTQYRIVAYTDTGQRTEQDIFVADLNRKLRINLTPSVSFDNNPQWSSDGRSVVFSCTLFNAATQNAERRLCRYDIGGAVMRLPIDHDAIQPQWSSDGSTIQYVHEEESRATEIRLFDVRDQSDILFVPLAGGYAASTWSPDGQQIAYAELLDMMEAWRIQVRSVENGQFGRLVAEDFTWISSLTWSPDGGTLACLCESAESGRLVEHIILIDLETMEQTRVLEVATSGFRPVITWMPDGIHLLTYNVFAMGKYQTLRLSDGRINFVADLGSGVTPMMRPDISQ